jgi:hypothetical protein
MGSLFFIASDDEVSILILIRLNTHSNASGMNRWDSGNPGLWVLKVDDDVANSCWVVTQRGPNVACSSVAGGGGSEEVAHLASLSPIL